MILARVAVAKSSRSAASSEDLSGTFYRVCRKTAPRTGAVSSLSDLCSPHDAYAPCPLLGEQRLASHRLLQKRDRKRSPEGVDIDGDDWRALQADSCGRHSGCRPSLLGGLLADRRQGSPLPLPNS